MEDEYDSDEMEYGSSVGESGESGSDDSEDDLAVVDPPTWSSYTLGMKNIPFTKENKLLVPIPGDKPIDWFRLLLDDVLLDSICTFTNSYALNVYYGNNTTPNSRICKWKDLTVQELLTFIGILIHMGTFQLSRIQDYWKKHRLFNIPSFREYMSRDRFLIILRCLYFTHCRPTNNEQASTSTRPAPSPTEKIDEVVHHFNTKMINIYYPSKELSIDESMVLWRGRLRFRQYIKNKRHKYGVKFYSVNEPEGLAMAFKIYAGSSDITSGSGHTDKVVLLLMNRFLGNGHSLFMDNYYNSFSLASKLLANNTYCTGTLRKARKYNPPEVTTKKLGVGQTVCKYAEGVVIGKWKDKREVLYISTQFENEMVTCANRFGVETQKPLPIVQYNAHMKGTDRHDQLLSYYPFEKKSLRWYKKIFVHILHMILINSHLLFNMHSVEDGRKKMSLYNFRLMVIEELLPAKPAAEVLSPGNRRPEHKLVKNDETCPKGFTKRKTCRVCYKEGRKYKQSIFICSACPGKPGLCAVECFTKFHK